MRRNQVQARGSVAASAVAKGVAAAHAPMVGKNLAVDGLANASTDLASHCACKESCDHGAADATQGRPRRAEEASQGSASAGAAQGASSTRGDTHCCTEGCTGVSPDVSRDNLV